MEIRIRDNGTGIPKDVKEKIFNPFFTTKPAGEGTGLGLSISHDIVVKQHGGTIDVDTQPATFTEFIITLPRAPRGDRRRHLSTYILVVDDEPDVAELFRQQFRRDLRAERFIMEFAMSAPEALERIKAIADPSLILILSDINMPGMTGLEMLPKVRAERPDVPVIMITAYGDAETKAQGAGVWRCRIADQADRLCIVAAGDRHSYRACCMTATILVVDDEPDLETLVLQKFRRQIRDGEVGVRVRPRRDRSAAIARIPSRSRPRGFRHQHAAHGRTTLLQKLQEAEDRKSTIIVSAYGDMSNIRTAMNRGAFDFLTKPIDFGDLETTIGKTLRHVQLLRDAFRRQVDAERAQASLQRYFSPQIASRLAAGGESDGMTVHRREIAVIFTDITSFTTLVEAIAPDMFGALLNEYMGGMTEIVFAHEGTVAKIIGDGIQILFNAPGDQPDYATRAVRCALDLDAWAQEFCARWSSQRRGLRHNPRRCSCR